MTAALYEAQSNTMMTMTLEEADAAYQLACENSVEKARLLNIAQVEFDEAVNWRDACFDCLLRARKREG